MFDEVWKKTSNIKSLILKEEAKALYDAIVENDSKLAVELGCYHGRSSSVMAEALQITNGVLYTFDSFVENFDGQSYTGKEALSAFLTNVISVYKNVKLKICNTDQPDDQTYKKLYGNVDIMFIDAGHDYESVKKDCEIWLPTLKKNGLVFFHDYNNEYFEVKKAVDELTENLEHIGPIGSMLAKRKL